MNGQLTAKKLAVRTASGLVVLIVVMAVCSLSWYREGLIESRS